MVQRWDSGSQDGYVNWSPVTNSFNKFQIMNLATCGKHIYGRWLCFCFLLLSFDFLQIARIRKLAQLAFAHRIQSQGCHLELQASWCSLLSSIRRKYLICAELPFSVQSPLMQMQELLDAELCNQEATGLQSRCPILINCTDTVQNSVAILCARSTKQNCCQWDRLSQKSFGTAQVMLKS